MKLFITAFILYFCFNMYQNKNFLSTQKKILFYYIKHILYIIYFITIHLRKGFFYNKIIIKYIKYIKYNIIYVYNLWLLIFPIKTNDIKQIWCFSNSIIKVQIISYSLC